MDTWRDAPGLGRVQPLLGLHKVRPKEGKAKVCFLTTCLVVGDFRSGMVFLHHRITPRGRRGCLGKREGRDFVTQAQVMVALKHSKVSCLFPYESLLEWATCVSGPLPALLFFSQFLIPFKCSPVSTLSLPSTPAWVRAHVLPGYCGLSHFLIKKAGLKLWSHPSDCTDDLVLRVLDSTVSLASHIQSTDIY